MEINTLSLMSLYIHVYFQTVVHQRLQLMVSGQGLARSLLVVLSVEEEHR